MKSLKFCIILLLATICYDACGEPLNLKWQEINGVSIPIPPREHPRLYLRSCHIPQLEERMKDPILSKVWQQLTEMSTKVRSEDDGAVRDWRYYVDQRGVSVQVEMDSLRYLITKDRAIARGAVTACLELLQNTQYPPEVGDVARASGRLMVTGAIVYDWCYDVLTAGEKAAYIEQFVRLAKTLECGYPPAHQGSITGHSSEWMIMRDLMSPAIAIYDEFPEMYELAAGRFFKEHLPARNWFYPAHIYHQGPNYDRARFAPDLYATWIFDRMGAGNVFHPSQQFICYSWFYRLRPDGQYMAAGDHIPMYGKPQYVGAAAMLAASYYKDEYINYEFVKRPSVDSRDKFFEFLWRDTQLGARQWDDLPLTRYFDFPYGWMIARTGWDDNAVIAELKINAYNFLNHQHHDAGAFQIYYKGALAIDSGIYQGSSGGGMQYNSPHNKNYFKRTIAHNSLLIYDPDEVFKSIGYGGAHNTEFADNDGGQLLPGNGWYGPNVLEDMFDESKNYKTGEILAYGFGTDYNKPDYTYLKGDITDAYSDKVSQVRRSFVFLNLKNDDVPAALIVYDKVVSTNKDFKKFWLLHSIEEPQIQGRTVTITRTKDGYSGKLVNDAILPEPENAQLTPIGGLGKEFWVFGTNYENEPQANYDLANERGAWRVELSPKKPANEDYFFNVMQVMDGDNDNPLNVSRLESDRLSAVQIGGRVVAFSKDTETIDLPTTLTVTGEGQIKILITDLKAGTWQVHKDGSVFIPAIPVRTDDGILYFEGTKGQYKFLR